MNRRTFLTGMAGILASAQAPLVGANLVRDGLIMRVNPIRLLSIEYIAQCFDVPVDILRPEYDWIKVTGIWNVGEGAGWYRADGTETTNYLESRQFTSHRQQRNP